MKQTLYSVLVVMLGMTASQKVNAQEADKTIIYSTTFDSEKKVKEWTVEGSQKEQNDFLMFNDKSMQINGYVTSTGMDKTNYVVSPVVTLSDDENVVTMNHRALYYYATPAEELNTLCVRTVGGEWIELPTLFFDGNESSFYSAGEFTLPAELKGQDVEFGFHYLYDGAANCGYWYIKDFEVYSQASTDPAPAEPYEVFSQTFNSNEDVKTWVVEGSQKDQEDFTMYNDKSMQINGYVCTSRDETNYVVSPVVKLDENFNTITFDHKCLYFFADPAEELTGLYVRTVGGEWVEINGIKYEESSNLYNAGVLDIPEQFNGKEVEFGFHLIYDNISNFGYWYVQNIKVMGNTGIPASIEEVENVEINNNKIYDLQGRIVENPTKGLYIINGKKVVIK